MFIIILNITAAALELLGAVLLANHYLTVRVKYIPSILFSALFKGRKAVAAANLARLSPDDPKVSLRGLAFLSLGFFIQLISSVIQICINAL